MATVGAGTFALAGCTDQLGGSNDGNESNGDGNGNETGGEGNESTDGDGQQVPPPAISDGELVSDFDQDLDEWFTLDGELAADEENALTGSRTARIEGEGASAGIGRAFPDGFNMEDQHLSLALRVDNPRPARVTVRIMAPGQSDQLWSTRTVLGPYEGWQRMDVGYTGQRGEPFLDNVQEIRITLDDPNASEESGNGNQTNATDDSNATEEAAGDGNGGGNGDGITFFVDDLRATPAASQGYVMLTFDDGVRSQYENAFSILQNRDMQGVVAVNPDSLNRESRLTIEQLREMRDADWDVSSHPEGPFQNLDDLEGMRTGIEDAYEYLDNRGFPDGARSMFVPYHRTNEEVVEITREYHDLSAYFGGTPSNVPFTDPMHLSRLDMHDIEGFTSLIDMAAQHNQLAIGLAHGVVPEDEIGDDPLADMTTQQLEELLDYIEESDVQVVTGSDLLDTDPSEL
ncbi:polysaccharide deacetylase family protein [Halalkalicoccus subterraneus]|uniref:polysaccharide deacetylase family protein n=1 Tax=Halalkalicoccus subterraneus TaxID=2675002 RepID=UPI001FE56656|nr:polysaccharide deacetylase family protein [Halalkalicoccus subterraneus]